MTEETMQQEEQTLEPDQNGSVLSKFRQAQKELRPFGKTKTLEVPGYEGLLAIEYGYISTEVTEAIAKKINKETRNVDGRGQTLLGSLDTLLAGAKRVVCRDHPSGEWRDLLKDQPPVKLGLPTARTIGFPAQDDREAVLGLFGTEHAIIQQNVIYSRWLANMKRTTDEDFL